jgi:hypothetical protein
VLLSTPLNLVPLILCSGIPTLTASASLGMVGGLLQLMALRRSDQQARLRI